METLLGTDAIDVEFAVDSGGQLHLLQVRRLAVDRDAQIDDAAVEAAAADVACKVELLSRPHPYLHGDHAIFGVMPDWNPAEIIGLKPRPLSLSLYRELITDAIWAYQRDNYGYKNLRSFPLLVNLLHGLPYVDVRVSFNSFIPRDLGDDLAGRLVNYYIGRLLAEPHLHDKVEFEIIFSCYTLDLPTRAKTLSDYGFSTAELGELSDALRRLTNRVIHGQTGRWRRDREKIDQLAERLPNIRDAGIDKISRIYWLIEDCKRYGTLPFAGLARAGFIAVQLLQSFVAVGVLSPAEHAAFLADVDTVGSRIGHDFAHSSKEEFLNRYGHLRPGTYDILSRPVTTNNPTSISTGLESATGRIRCPAICPVDRAVPADRAVIEGTPARHRRPDFDGNSSRPASRAREYAKFVFTRSLSDVLSLIKELGQEYGLSRA